MSVRRGERRRVPCDRLVCGVCGPIAALRTVSAILLAKPDRSGIATWATALGDQLAVARTLRIGIRAMVGELRAAGFEWEHVSVVELSPAGRPHVHFLQRGDSVPAHTLRDAALSVGVGRTEMAPIRRPPVIARYLLKVPLRALDVPVRDGADVMLEHVVLNGGRLVSSTRGFWMTADGRPIVGSAQARRAARDAWLAGWRPN